MTNIDILRQGLEKYSPDNMDKVIDKFVRYKDLLLEWNKKINLTAIEDEKEIYIKHFLDSLSFLDTNLVGEKASIIDVGTGAGFPGIAVKIMREDIDLTLLDSLNKRINFLKTVGDQLELDGITYIHSRAEDGGRKKELRESFDIATARAVANLAVLMEYCVPYVKVGGYFICLKGPSVEEEIKQAKTAAEVLGIELIDVFHVKLPDENINHNVVVFKKIKSTPKRYPRKAGTPNKLPIK